MTDTFPYVSQPEGLGLPSQVTSMGQLRPIWLPGPPHCCSVGVCGLALCRQVIWPPGFPLYRSIAAALGFDCESAVSLGRMSASVGVGGPCSGRALGVPVSFGMVTSCCGWFHPHTHLSRLV